MDPEVVVQDQHLKIDLLQLLITKDHQDHSITNPDSTKVLCQGRTKVSTEQPSMVRQEVLTIDLPCSIKDLQDHLKINQGSIKVHLWDVKDLIEMPLIMMVPDPLIDLLIMTVQDHLIKDLLPVVSTMDLLHEALVMGLHEVLTMGLHEVLTMDLHEVSTMDLREVSTMDLQETSMDLQEASMDLLLEASMEVLLVVLIKTNLLQTLTKDFLHHFLNHLQTDLGILQGEIQHQLQMMPMIGVHLKILVIQEQPQKK